MKDSKRLFRALQFAASWPCAEAMGCVHFLQQALGPAWKGFLEEAGGAGPPKLSELFRCQWRGWRAGFKVVNVSQLPYSRVPAGCLVLGERGGLAPSRQDLDDQ